MKIIDEREMKKKTDKQTNKQTKTEMNKGNGSYSERVKFHWESSNITAYIHF